MKIKSIMKLREISIVLFIISSIINILAWLAPFIMLRLVMIIIVVSLVLAFFYFHIYSGNARIVRNIFLLE